jgi:hypothetical protein
VGEIEARLSAATPGPWEEFWRGHIHARDERGTVSICQTFGPEDQIHADAEFIANAPADVAYLLAELRKAHEALAAVESVHYEGIAYADDVAEGSDETIPDDYEHHFCQEDGEDWPCTTMAALRAAVAAANGDGL